MNNRHGLDSAADRFQYIKLVTGAIHDISRSTDVPTATEANTLANYSLLLDCTTLDATIDAGDLVTISQTIEGYNYKHLEGRTATLSFWVKATKTGTYCVSFRNSGKKNC